MNSTRRTAARRLLAAAALAVVASSAGLTSTSAATPCDHPTELRVMTAHGPRTWAPAADETCG